MSYLEKRKMDNRYNIKIIIQSNPQMEKLKTSYLAELMDLSVDKPINLFNFDLNIAKDKIKKCPLIKRASLKKVNPNAIYIDYRVRKPLAWIIDLNNVAVDKEGYLFPILPFFSPKVLPEIYLGDRSFLDEEDFYTKPLESEKLKIGLKILKLLDDPDIFIKRIDLSAIFHSSLGKREIVLSLEHELILKEKDATYIFPRLIRLCVSEYEKQLANYISLNKKIMDDYKTQLLKQNLPSTSFSEKTVDMRIEKLAFVDN